MESDEEVRFIDLVFVRNRLAENKAMLCASRDRRDEERKIMSVKRLKILECW